MAAYRFFWRDSMNGGIRDPKVGSVSLIIATILIIPLMLPIGFGFLSVVLGVLSVVFFTAGTLIIGTSGSERPV